MVHEFLWERKSRPVLMTLEERVNPATFIPGFQETVFASGLSTPTSMEFAPDGRLFVTEKGGNVRIVQNGTLLSTPFLSLSVSTNSERGLQSLTFDPNFATNRFVYVYYTTNDATPVNRVSRFTADPNNPNVVLAGSEAILINNITSTGNHNGGALHFGTDGMLYVAVGDANQLSNVQNLGSLLGKILRIDVSNPSNVIPADNPFVNTPGARGEIWAVGFRNPFTFAVQPGTGKIFINDVGSNQFEEINELQAGGNYGWPNVEGSDNGNPAFIDPVYFYPTAPGGSIAGGAFYQGTNYPASFNNGYFFADFVKGFIQFLPNGASQPTDFATGAQGPVDLDFGPDGNLYYLSLFTGMVYQVTFTTPDPIAGQPVIVVAPETGGGPHVKVFNANGSARLSFFAYAPTFTGGVRTASADLNGDGIPEIITATGPGGGPHIKVFNGVDATEIASFFAFDAGFRGGVNLAVGDVNNDGVADILAAAGSLGGPHVRVFDGTNFQEIGSFFAFSPSFTGGVNLAAGDMNGDGAAEIIVGAGPGGGPHVRILNGLTLGEISSFFAYSPNMSSGVFVAVGDVNNDGIGDILTGPGSGGPHVRIWSGSNLTELASFFVVNPTQVAATHLSAKDLDGDGFAEAIIGFGAGTTSTVRSFSGTSLTNGSPTLLDQFDAFDPNFQGGIFVG